jgi:hypothetical protein
MKMTDDKRSSIGKGMIYTYALKAVILLTLSSGCMGSQFGNSDYGQNQPTITQATTLTTVGSSPPVDFSQVSVFIAGCDDDAYNNSMVAGYVTNNGVNVINTVPIVTRLLNSSDEVVFGGEKTTVITNLKPGERQQFSVVYVKPPAWAKCRASVNGVWTTL